MDESSSSSPSSLQNRYASDVSETNGDSVAQITPEDGARSVDSIRPQSLTTENVVDFSLALTQLIWAADFLSYLDMRKLFALTLLSKEISMLTRDYISKRHTFKFGDYNTRKLQYYQPIKVQLSFEQTQSSQHFLGINVINTITELKFNDLFNQ
eukprot:TRINITY_DN8578_c0_g1_i1.p1 TRINITY_DN8578_c0_g1~~TRINITY_DN8578_c0_g1_i1.p1  ORF type:complete len:154 (-),score=29.79 TRINITY_DN8578_c0_g1_i1:68-529(-)